VIETFNSHRPLLFGIAYRMLGRASEAEDLVQETWLRWQKQDAATVRAPKAWLVSTITRLCIDQLRSARQQRVDYYGVWLPEPLVDESVRRPDEMAALADSLSMAFMLMLEELGPIERAAFLLREVFDYEYAEIAAIVGKSEANCRQIVRRAKESLAPARSAPSAVPNEQAKKVVQRFLDAVATGEVGDLMALLTEDATLYTDGGGRVASAGRPIRTADHISRFFVGIRRRLTSSVSMRPAEVNGQAGALVFIDGRLDRAIACDLDGERIRAIYLVRNPEKLRHLSRASANDGMGNAERR
jgi:RNA polymerase sigma-70 factor, ECF subfamily